MANQSDWVVLDHVMWFFQKDFPGKSPSVVKWEKMLQVAALQPRKKKLVLHLYSMFISIWNIREKKT